MLTVLGQGSQLLLFAIQRLVKLLDQGILHAHLLLHTLVPFIARESIMNTRIVLLPSSLDHILTCAAPLISNRVYLVKFIA